MARKKKVVDVDFIQTRFKVLDIGTEACQELERATKKYGSFASPHEGYAILKEEVDELWDAIKANESPQRKREEAIQVAAMALRFVLDCCDE